MNAPDAAQAGSFTLGDIDIHRLGFGAMRIVGEGVWGPPRDRAEALRTLRRLPELGVNFIDTADSYGPDISETLICEALHPYRDLLVATKGGLARHGPDLWLPLGRPEYLRQTVLMSLRRLRIDRIDLWQLHRIDPQVPRDEQFDAIAQMQKEGLIRHVGLSEVGVEDIGAARRHFEVVSVQNLYNLVSRQHEEVVDFCAAQGIGFIPWFPLSAGRLAQPGGLMDDMARRLGVTATQIALAWVLRSSPCMLPIPGTGKVKHLEENVGAAALRLSDEDFSELSRLGRQVWEAAEAARSRPPPG